MAQIIIAIGPVPVNLVNEIHDYCDVWLIEERKSKSFKIVPSLWAKRLGMMETSEEEEMNACHFTFEQERAFEVVAINYRC